MHTNIACAEIATIGVDAPQQLAPALPQLDARRNSVVVAARLFELHLQPMIAAARLVQQQPHRSVIIGDHDINLSVIIYVSERGATAHFGKSEHGASAAGNLDEP